MRAQVGDVVRWTRAWGRDLPEPMWTLVLGDLTYEEDDGVEPDLEDVLIFGAPAGYELGTTDSFSDEEFPMDGEAACAEIMHPDDWPDEIYKAVAMYRLTGELQ